MKKASRAASKIREVEPKDKRVVDPTKFKLDLSATDVKKLIGPLSGIVIFPFLPIETLKVTKVLGLGRTNITIVAPTVVQADANPPRASFNRASQPRKPAIQMHFQPSGYGISSTGTYIMEFTLQVLGTSTFNLVGNAGTGTVLNAGTKTLTGAVRVSMIFKDVPPQTETVGFVEQLAGGPWDWFAVQVRFPDPIISP